MNPTPSDANVESFFHQTVNELAHYLYVLRGCKEGHDVDNWIEAETQLKSRLFLGKRLAGHWLSASHASEIIEKLIRVKNLSLSYC